MKLLISHEIPSPVERALFRCPYSGEYNPENTCKKPLKCHRGRYVPASISGGMDAWRKSANDRKGYYEDWFYNEGFLALVGDYKEASKKFKL
jgi:hypothetical protein